MRALPILAVVAVLAACTVASPSPSNGPSEAAASQAPSVGETLVLAPTPPPGEPWTSVLIDDEGFPLDLISRPEGGLLAVGFDGTGNDPRAWLTDDEATWAEATGVPAAPDDAVWHFGRVVWSGTRYVAAGEVGVRDSEVFHSGIWTSQDGNAWQKVADLDGILLDLIAGGPGLLAVGTRYGDSHYNGAVAWSSVDGVTWTEAAEIPGGEDAAIADVVAFDGGFVAVGGRGDELAQLDAAVWRSADGVQWSAVDLDASPSHQSFSGVAVVDGRLVATASVQVQPPALWSAAIWSSADGTSWSREYERGCCGEFLDLIGGPDPVALLLWHQPNTPYRAAQVIGDGGSWEVEGAVDDGTVSWTALVETDSGLLGLGARNGIRVPLLLTPPASR
jgi:hypothetical protein